MRAKVSEEMVQLFGDICRKAGVKLTQQRLEVFREIAGARDHPTVEELHRRLRQRLPTLALDTVYRTLDTLERFGVVLRLQAPDGAAHFDGNPVRHHHLLCTRCGTIADAVWPSFDDMELPAEAQRWGQVHQRCVQLQGVCRNCLGREKRPTG